MSPEEALFVNCFVIYCFFIFMVTQIMFSFNLKDEVFKPRTQTPKLYKNKFKKIFRKLLKNKRKMRVKEKSCLNYKHINISDFVGYLFYTFSSILIIIESIGHYFEKKIHFSLYLIKKRLKKLTYKHNEKVIYFSFHKTFNIFNRLLIMFFCIDPE